MTPIRLIRGVFTVGGWTLLSRVLGFIRDALILAWLGTGPVYEAFVVAFRLPNMFRRFFAEGAFNMAFVPMFSKRLETGDDPRGFAQEALAGLASVLFVLTVLAHLVMPWLIWGLASGFNGQEQFSLSVEFARITFPYIVFISLAALISGALNAMGRFVAAAAAPVLLNVLLIGGMILAQLTGGSVAYGLIYMIPVAGFVQLALVWWALARAGITLRLTRPRWSPEMRHLVRVAIPAALAGGVVQVNLLVGQQVASYFDRAVGWLYAADRLYQLPLGVVGIAIGIVLLPDLSRKLAANDDTGGRAALSRAGELALAITLPSAVALMVVPLPLVSVLFERGAMTPADSAAIAAAVAIYGAGLPAFVLQKILQPIYFAREDTRSPFRYAVWAMVINAVLAVGLAPVLGWIAPAIATTVAGWAMVWQLSRGAQHFGDVAKFDRRFRTRLGRIVLSSTLMGGGVYGLSVALTPWLFTDTVRYGALAVLVFGGMAIYIIAAQITGALRLSEIKGMMRH